MEEKELLLLYAQKLGETTKQLNALEKQVSSFLPKVELRNGILTIANLSHKHVDCLEFGKHGVNVKRSWGNTYYPYPNVFYTTRADRYFCLRSPTDSDDMIKISSWDNGVGFGQLDVIVNEYCWSSTQYPVCFRPEIDAALEQSMQAFKWEKK